MSFFFEIKEEKIRWDKHPFTPLDYIKSNEDILDFHIFIITHPFFCFIRTNVFILYFLAKPFQLLFGTLWFIFYLFKLFYCYVYKKDFDYKDNPFKRGSFMIIFYSAPRAKAYDILYKIIKKLCLRQKQPMNIRVLSYQFIISRLFVSPSAINYINRISKNLYLILINDEHQLYNRFYNNLKPMKKYKFLLKLAKKTLKLILANSKCISNANNQKILYRNGWVFNPPKYLLKGSPKISKEKLLSLPNSEENISINYTKDKKIDLYLPHLSINDRWNFGKYKDECIFTHYPMKNQVSIVVPFENSNTEDNRPQHVVINNMSENCLVKEYDGSQTELLRFTGNNHELLIKNIDIARLNNNVNVSLQKFDNNRLFSLDTNETGFYEQLFDVSGSNYNLKSNSEVMLDFKEKYAFFSDEPIKWRTEEDHILREFTNLSPEIDLKLKLKSELRIFIIKNNNEI